MNKNINYEKARRLRRDGCSIRQIVKKLGISQGSASMWTRDILLTKDQKEKIYEKTSRQNIKKAGKKWSKICSEKRKEYFLEGSKIAKRKEWLHTVGCMLYWGEGGKTGNKVVLGNSDPRIIKLFLSFLEFYFGIKKENIAISIQCYLGNGISKEEIEQYWVDILNLPKECLRKTSINKPNKSSKGTKKGKLKYGVCQIQLYNFSHVHIFNHIMGAIEEYSNL